MARTVDMAKLMAKIAKVTDTSVDELKEAAQKGSLYSHDEAVMEAQSVINFYRARIMPKPPEKKAGETPLEYARRKREYEQAFNEWRIKKCEGCSMDFAYAYHYDGVKFCSLDCLDAELRRIGLSVTRGRDLRKRWGVRHPAIVPSTALEALRVAYPSAVGAYSDQDESNLPTHHTNQDSA